MWVYFSPQRSNNKLDYNFNGNQVVVTYNNELQETFDLTDMYETTWDGDRRIKDPEILPVKPILSVVEKDGAMWVTVLNFHGPNPPREIAFPDWVEV